MDWYIHISDIQVVVAPLVEKLNITNLTTPHIITIDIQEAIQLSKDLQGQLNEPEP